MTLAWFGLKSVILLKIVMNHLFFLLYLRFVIKNSYDILIRLCLTMTFFENLTASSHNVIYGTVRYRNLIIEMIHAVWFKIYVLLLKITELFIFLLKPKFCY